MGPRAQPARNRLFSRQHVTHRYLYDPLPTTPAPSCRLPSPTLSLADAPLPLSASAPPQLGRTTPATHRRD